MMMQALLSPLYPKHFALSLKLRPGRIFSQSSASPFCRSARHAFSQSSLELFLRSSIIMYSLNKLASFPLNKVLIPSSQDESDRIQNLSALCSPSTPKHGLCRPNRLGVRASFPQSNGGIYRVSTPPWVRSRWRPVPGARNGGLQWTSRMGSVTPASCEIRAAKHPSSCPRRTKWTQESFRPICQS
ncbi:Ankyrin repeat-containing domain protein [Metarhizium robertsii ARSEF 23]|uniref:Ankyrin repeat-containing domain protein n=1 Tax=Metarhizium robertsii (strain ARSEF 23 / ATCC MYA-3075) TaxID=655844 RepID=A0A0B2XG75_METRA|nr:Ankyrin repeat-containing domain protein [Metarhizium robertsii ARSEF 23]KHO10562.1 Ankyrin repeat-containing domain protein [Metarhizium robertsii ARSEF 23]